jgi:hypothetical protein
MWTPSRLVSGPMEPDRSGRSLILFGKEWLKATVKWTEDLTTNRTWAGSKRVFPVRYTVSGGTTIQGENGCKRILLSLWDRTLNAFASTMTPFSTCL